jgi:NAD(P)-dependent dehydrogenase (short-subunit alcohol dehydrogenase family)
MRRGKLRITKIECIPVTAKFSQPFPMGGGVEMGSAGIQVNCVCPGGMMGTAMYERIVAANPQIPDMVRGTNPMGRDGEPEEVAEAVVWLCSDVASYVNGHAMSIDGGFAIV